MVGYDIPFINDGTPVASLWDVLRCLAYGSASLVPYWYIPFIMTVFSVGPLIFHLPTGLLCLPPLRLRRKGRVVLHWLQPACDLCRPMPLDVFPAGWAQAC